MEFFMPNMKDISVIQSAMAGNHKQGCEMSPANTVLWAKHYCTEIGFWDKNIIFRSASKDGFSYSCNLKDAEHAKALFDHIISLTEKEKVPFHMHCVLEEEMQLIEQWYPGEYQIEYNRDYFDYIYLREKLATLSGKKLHSKRNHIHRFEENHPDWKYERISSENEMECMKMAEQWCMENCKNEQEEILYDKIDESKLVVYAIKHREELGLIGGAIRTNRGLVAITLGERLTEDTFVVHFEKAFSIIQGAYAIMNREFVRNELQAYQYVNREEDLGEEGLRKAKLSYYPEILLKKGWLSKKEA